MSYLKSPALLALGLIIGAYGSFLFKDSFLGEEGSPEQRAAELEVKLKIAENRLAAYEADPTKSYRKKTLQDGLRKISEDLRAGREVSPDDVFRATQPLMRDLSPLFDRIRQRQEEREIERRVGEYTRKYDLNSAQQKSLEEWFTQKRAQNAEEYNQLLLSEGTSLSDLAKYAMDQRADEGLDEFMGKTLSGEKLTQYRQERLVERSERVQREADAKVQKIDHIVTLDEEQRDKLFVISAKNSKDYDPSLAIVGADNKPINGVAISEADAIRSVLRPDQLQIYNEEEARRREEARKNAEAIGLTLPENWEMLNFPDF